MPGGCKSCGAVNRTDDKFCGGCAKPLRALPSVFKEQRQAETVPIDISDVISET